MKRPSAKRVCCEAILEGLVETELVHVCLFV